MTLRFLSVTLLAAFIGRPSPAQGYLLDLESGNGGSQETSWSRDTNPMFTPVVRFRLAGEQGFWGTICMTPYVKANEEGQEDLRTFIINNWPFLELVPWNTPEGEAQGVPDITIHPILFNLEINNLVLAEGDNGVRKYWQPILDTDSVASSEYRVWHAACPVWDDTGRLREGYWRKLLYEADGEYDEDDIDDVTAFDTYKLWHEALILQAAALGYADPAAAAALFLDSQAFKEAADASMLYIAVQGIGLRSTAPPGIPPWYTAYEISTGGLVGWGNGVVPLTGVTGSIHIPVVPLTPGPGDGPPVIGPGNQPNAGTTSRHRVRKNQWTGIHLLYPIPVASFVIRVGGQNYTCPLRTSRDRPGWSEAFVPLSVPLGIGTIESITNGAGTTLGGPGAPWAAIQVLAQQ